jgi:6-phosphogluconate dehydrogenase
MVGTGSMGSMMSMLYAEHGLEVHFYDPDDQNVENLLRLSKTLKTDTKIVRQDGYEQLCKSIKSEDQPRLFVFSIPHGEVGDRTVEGLLPFLEAGDIILDCSNEYWKNTERRQEKLGPKDIFYIGCGVSGGYHSARHGPSMSPGGPKEALEKVSPLLQRVAAKDNQGRPCTTAIGPGGSGHYVKTVHNGIEQGMMSALAEIWYLMTTCLEMTYEEVGQVFARWNKTGPLRDNFLIDIGADIHRIKDNQGNYVLANVRDKVVQDVNESEGTGIWTCEEAMSLHVSAATIVTGHMFRLTSANAARRAKIEKSFGKSIPAASVWTQSGGPRDDILEDLQQSLYAAFLSCFVQGIQLLRQADNNYGWGLDYIAITRIWRGGCIIQSDYISDLLESVLFSSNEANSVNDDLLYHPELVEHLAKAFSHLKKVVLRAIEADACVPSLSATLEWLKYSSSTDLPTQFMEAQLDYFGAHNYDLKSEPIKEGVQKGKNHFEWKQARAILD